MNQEIIAYHRTYDRMAKNAQQKDQWMILMYHSYPLSHWVTDSERHRKANVYWLPPWRISFQTQDPKTQERLMPRLADLVTQLLHVSAADAWCEDKCVFVWFCHFRQWFHSEISAFFYFELKFAKERCTPEMALAHPFFLKDKWGSAICEMWKAHEAWQVTSNF